MKVTNINYSQGNRKARLSAQVIFNNGKTHEVYFEVDNKFTDFVAKDASPFLAAVITICMKKKEDIEIDGNISSAVLASTHEIMKKIVNWNMGFKCVNIQVKGLRDTSAPKYTGCFFSGGVDSFYTYLKNKDKINKLIFVHGFDISIHNEDLYNTIRKNIVNISNEERKDLIEVKTNIRDLQDHYGPWTISHPFALASVSLFLRHGLKDIYMSCGLPNRNVDHHFMTPDLDVLWSTESMHINHYGCDADKIDKIKYISKFSIVQKNLRVCWVNKKDAYNCSECEKCLRNVLGLYVSDSLEKCITFDKNINLDRLKNVRVDEYCLKYYKALLKALTLKNDHSEVRYALEESIKRNENPKLRQKLVRNTKDSIGYIDKKYNSDRLYWFFAKKGLVN